MKTSVGLDDKLLGGKCEGNQDWISRHFYQAVLDQSQVFCLWGDDLDVSQPF